MFDDQSPIYRQIAGRIRADVASGTLAADEQVMSTTQYASFYGINPATAAKAFQQLVDEGIIYKRRGVGMFVAPGAREQVLADRRRRYFDEVLAPALAEADLIDLPVRDILDFIANRSGKGDQ